MVGTKAFFLRLELILSLLGEETEVSEESDDSEELFKELWVPDTTFMHERPYEKLIVWKEAHKLCISTYILTKNFPSSEKFELTKQVRRAAGSVPTNLAEGNSRRYPKDKLRFFNIAHASLEEVHYHFRLSKDLGYISMEIFEKVDDQVQRTSFLLDKLRASIQSSVSSDSLDSSDSFLDKV